MSPGIATPALMSVLLVQAIPLAAQRTTPLAIPVTVVVEANRPLAVFDPSRAWGAALDGHDYRETSTVYTPWNIAEMRSAGLGPITYRLRTELAIETWHWNPRGRWSDPAHQQGYWISDDSAPQPIEMTFGYRLPRRGRTIDDGNSDSYSRLDDGDTASFWKTNPYLDSRFTHDSEAEHPQWFSIDLDRPRRVSEIRLLWGNPYPRRYEVDYWSGTQSALIDDNPAGAWRSFPRGSVTDGHGGDADIVLGAAPVTTRFLRVVMYQSSHTAAASNGDPRDSLGFALREVLAGTRDRKGVFHDVVRHDTVATEQSTVLVSSTDPWHRAVDRDSDEAQPGFDLIYHSGLTNHLPMLVPTGLLFDTPENAANELRFLRRRGYPVQGVELGEEPDGQRVTPEDFAALYLQFATALRGADPAVPLGGPSFQTLLDDPLVLWPDRASPGRRDSWIGRFLDYLDARHRTADYQFFSFEWYPFDNVCDDPAANVAAAPGMLTASLARIRRNGLPDSIPGMLTEYGYSAHLALAEITLPGAVFDADLVPNVFASGAVKSFFYGYEPGYLAHQPDCPHWGNLVMFLADSTGAARYRTPRYQAAWMLTHAWADSTGGQHTMVAAMARTMRPGHRDTLVSAYALHRPDGRWSVLLVNRDGRRARTVTTLRVAGSAGPARSFGGPIDIWQYSDREYHFHEAGEFGHPTRDLPPAHRTAPLLGAVSLPPYSVTVVTGT